MARKNQILLGTFPPDPWADPDYWERINSRTPVEEPQPTAPTEVDWAEVREKYEARPDEESFDPFLYGTED